MRDRENLPTDVRKLNFSVDEGARVLGVSSSLLRLEAKRGNVRILRIGNRILLPRAELMRLAGMNEADG